MNTVYLLIVFPAAFLVCYWIAVLVGFTCYLFTGSVRWFLGSVLDWPIHRNVPTARRGLTEAEKAELAEMGITENDIGLTWRDPTLWILAIIFWPVFIWIAFDRWQQKRREDARSQ